MAENTDEEHLNNPTNIESENPPDENPPTTDTEINIQNQGIETMEVHKHPHHITHKKKWSEYFLEFLMLFLAVFLGFIAENMREHNVEHKRAKDFAISLLEEVTGDTIALNKSISYYKYRIKNLDTLIELLSGDIKQIPGGTLYYFADMSMYNNQMIFNKTTLKQLINSGALRYFTNRKLVKCIGAYDQVLEKVENSAESNQIVSLEVRKLQFKIFEFKFKAIYNNKQSSGINSDSIKKTQFPLLTYEQSTLSEYTNWLNLRRANLSFYMTDNLRESQNKAKELLTLLKKEYNLE